MARVELKSQANGVVLDSNGNVVVNASVAIKNLDGTAATHWSAKTGGTSSTANVVTSADGTIPRFIETGSYNIQVTPPGGSMTAFPLEAVNADQVVGATAGAWAGVQEEGANLTTRGRVNFIGAGVTAADDSANGRTNVTIPGGGGGGSAHTIQDEGSGLAARTGLNFTGSGVTATDDGANDRTNVTIPGSTGHTIQNEGSALTARTGLNFVGANVTAADDAANNRTNVTISGGGTGGHTIQDEGSSQTARTNLNFVGAGVAVTDSSGTNSTVVTVPGGGGVAGEPGLYQDANGHWWSAAVGTDGGLVTTDMGVSQPTGIAPTNTRAPIIETYKAQSGSWTTMPAEATLDVTSAVGQTRGPVEFMIGGAGTSADAVVEFKSRQHATQPGTQMDVTYTGVAPATGTRNLNIPFGSGNTNDSNLSNNNWIIGCRFVPKSSVSLSKFMLQMKSQGAGPVGSWDPAGAPYCSAPGAGCYGAGNGGTIEVKLVPTTAAGHPDMSNVLFSETFSPPTRYAETRTFFGISTLSLLYYFNCGNTPVIGGVPYVLTLRNIAASPNSNFVSHNSVCCHRSVAGPHDTNTTNANASGAIAGMDPRETMCWSTNLGSTWTYGYQVGNYYGDSSSASGTRLPQYGYITSTGTLVPMQPYSAYNITITGGTTRATNARKAVTITHGGGYGGGNSVGVVTVTNVTTGVSGSTPSLGGGMPVGVLNNPVPVAVGNTVDYTASGTVYRAMSDGYTDAAFDTGTGDFPFLTGGTADIAQVFGLPWPHYVP